jgi:hypothetical protein
MLRLVRATLPTAVVSIVLAACAGPSGNAAPSAANLAPLPEADVRSIGSLHSALTYKIYVSNIDDNTITAYLSNGVETSPTITVQSNPNFYVTSVAVAPNGTIYALSYNFSLFPNTNAIVTSYKRDGTRISPTISVPESGLDTPSALAVSDSGTIYVLSSVHDGTPGVVVTYHPDGSPTPVAFQTGPDSSCMAIAGTTIYVGNAVGPGKSRSGYLSTYSLDGTPKSLTITDDIYSPGGVAVDPLGNIYVANVTNGGPDGTAATYLTMYSPTGQLLRKFSNGAGGPGGIATDPSGRLYVATSTPYTSTMRTYEVGTRIPPTFGKGLDEPSGIAIAMP